MPTQPSNPEEPLKLWIPTNHESSIRSKSSQAAPGIANGQVRQLGESIGLSFVLIVLMQRGPVLEGLASGVTHRKGRGVIRRIQDGSIFRGKRPKQWANQERPNQELP